MLTKLIERIDAIGERLSPIVVWEFRQAYRCENLEVAWFIFTSIIIFTASVCLFYVDDIEKEMTRVKFDESGLWYLLFIPMICYCGAFISIIGIELMMIIFWSSQKECAPDLYVALTSEQVYDGYYQMIIAYFCFLLSPLFCIVLFLNSFHFIPVDVVLYMIVLLVVQFVLVNIGYTIACCCNTNNKRAYVQLVTFIMVLITNIIPTGCVLIGFALVSVKSIVDRHILTIEHWLPLLAVATIIYLYTCKRLNKCNRQPKRSEWMKLFVTMSTLFTLTAIITGLGFLNYWYFGA